MLKIEVRAVNDDLCADVVDFVWVEEGLSKLEQDRLIYNEVYNWMLDYCEKDDDEEHIESSRIEILNISKE